MRGGVIAVGRRNELPELVDNACSALVLKMLYASKNPSTCPPPGSATNNANSAVDERRHHRAAERV